MAKQTDTTTDAKKYVYTVVEDTLLLVPDGTNKKGEAYKAYKGRTSSGKLVTVIPVRQGVARLIVEERSEA